MKSFKQELSKASRYYKQWKKQKCYCPALDAYILITNIGWYHLMGDKKHQKRSSADKFRRFKILPYAKQVIESSHKIYNTRKVQGRTYYTVESIIPISINKVKTLTKIRVVIYEDIKGNKIFLSVMDKKM